jgi:hypothetical protein
MLAADGTTDGTEEGAADVTGTVGPSFVVAVVVLAVVDVVAGKDTDAWSVAS